MLQASKHVPVGVGLVTADRGMPEIGKTKSTMRSGVTCHAIRLKPGQNITDEIVRYVTSNGMKSAFIMTCVGSITKAKIRLAHATSGDRQHVVDIDDKHEITSLVGTISSSGSFHLHTTLGDYQGRSISGHVIGEMLVYTTAEIVLGECDDLQFAREFDEETGFDELVIKNRTT